MDNVITFTPAELVSVIIGICTAVVTVSACIGVIAKWFSKARAPEIKQNLRLDAIDKRLEEIDKVIDQFREYFQNDDNRFKAIERSNKITQTALLALLKYSINGNDKESLVQAEKSLEEYLIDK
ncbi:MAG: hypothetical protein J6U23_05620 [Clostridiales bacterium]|nr:hypothetical protein [Clostridiales bacterium]